MGGLVNAIQKIKGEKEDCFFSSTQFLGLLKDYKAFENEELYVENVLTQIVNGGFVEVIIGWKGINSIKYANDSYLLAHRMANKYGIELEVALNVINQLSLGLGIVQTIPKRADSNSMIESDDIPKDSNILIEQGINAVNDEIKVNYYVSVNGDLNPNVRELVLGNKLDSIKKYAQNGNPNAQYLLAIILMLGIGVKKNARESIKWLRLSASQQYSLALIALGDEYAKGEIVNKDKKKAIRLYSSAVQNSYASTQYEIGLYYYRKKKYKDAVNCFEKSAVNNHGFSMYMLGECYFYGNGVCKDFKKAIEFYTYADSKNVIDAKYSLGYMYENHYGTDSNLEFDEARAIVYYEGAAKLNNIPSCFRLGLIAYKHKEFDVAIKWFIYPAKQGYAKAQLYLGSCYLILSVVSYDSHDDYCKLAYEWFFKSAMQGNEKAKDELVMWQCYWPDKFILP